MGIIPNTQHSAADNTPLRCVLRLHVPVVGHEKLTDKQLPPKTWLFSGQ